MREITSQTFGKTELGNVGRLGQVVEVAVAAEGELIVRGPVVRSVHFYEGSKAGTT